MPAYIHTYIDCGFSSSVVAWIGILRFEIVPSPIVLRVQ